MLSLVFGVHILSVEVQYVALVTLFVRLAANVLSFSSNVDSNVSITWVSGLAITFFFDV